MVVVVMGFVTPRLIADYQGRELLGIWDFGWSLIVYISFLAFGITSAANRYVAAYRTTQDWAQLNAVVSTSLLLLSVAAGVGVAATAGIVLFIPSLLADTSVAELTTARWLVLLLALKAALQLPAGVFNGVITGYERFDRLNAIRIVRDVGTLTTFVGILMAGYGIVALGGALLVWESAASVAKIVVARRLCPHLHCSFALCNGATVRQVLSFGGRTVTQSMAQGGIYQGSSLIVAAFLGPASLAIYSRQRALVLHAQRFVKQYAQVFIPRSSGLQAADRDEALRDTLVQTTRYGLFIAVPLMLILLIMGGPLLLLWMGPEYEAPLVLGVMALGHLLYIPQMGVYSVLMGMGKHGVPAVVELGAAVVSVGAGLLWLGLLGGKLVAAACAMTVPLAISGGVILPLYACRLLRLSPWRYVRESAVGPLLAGVPLLASLTVARLTLDASPLLVILVGLLPGGLLTLAIYVRWVLPARFRRSAARLFGQSRPDVPQDAVALTVTDESGGPGRG